MGLRIDLAGRVRPVELPEPEHLREAADQRSVHGLDLEARVLECGLDVRLVEPLGVGHLVIQAGVDCRRARAARPEVGLHVALEAPLGPQDVGERVPVLGRVHAPHAVVGAHDRRELGVLDQHLERQQVQLPQDVLVHLDVGPEALVLLVVDHVMLAHRDHVVRLDGPGHRDPHRAGQVRVLGEVLEVATGDRGAMQAHAGALQDVLAQRRRLGADDVPVAVRQLDVKAGGQADRHRQRRGGRARRPVAHADPHRAVGDPKARDPQLLDRRHVPLDLELVGELLEVAASARAE